MAIATSLDRIAASLGRRTGKTALALAILSLVPVAALAADVPVKIKKVTSGDVEGYAPGQKFAITVECANESASFLLGDGDEASLLAPTGESCAVSETAVTPSGYASTTVITVSGDSQVPRPGVGKVFTLTPEGATVVVASSLKSRSSSTRLEVVNRIVGVEAGLAYLFADTKFQVQAHCTDGYSVSKWVAPFATATFDLGAAAAPHSCSVTVLNADPAVMPNGYSSYAHTVFQETFMPQTVGVQVAGVFTIPR